MKNAWAIADTPSAGDLTEDDLYASIGRSLTCWEKAEGGLAELFGMIVTSGRDSRAAERAYGTLGAFRARIELLEEAARIFIANDPSKKTLIEVFKELRTLYGNAISRRNEIAHGIVIPYNYLCYMFGDPFREAPGYCLISAEYNTSKRYYDNKSKYVYTTGAIDRYAALFDEVTISARSLFAHIRKNNIDLS